MRKYTPFALLLLLITFAPVFAAAPEYHPVKPTLFVPRDGLGNVLAKLEKGGEVRIAYLGGSITAQQGYRVFTRKWFAEQFPKADVKEINAAIGGTGSDLGVFRLGHDVLAHKPDLVFVEFAVNDGGAPPDRIWKAMEGIVRQIWQADSRTDIIFVYTVTHSSVGSYDKGENPRSTSAMEMLADHYGIPSANMGMRIAEYHREGKLIMKANEDGSVPAGAFVFAKDGVHPGSEGHHVYTSVVTEAVTAMRSTSKPMDHASKLSNAFVEDNWEAAKMVPVTEAKMIGDWQKLPAGKGLGKRFGKRMGDIYLAAHPGDALEFKFRGNVAKLYDLLGPDGGQVNITLDGKTRGPVARFDHYCTYHRIATLHITSNADPNAVHTVRVEVAPGQPDRSSVTDREKDKPNFNPKKYDGTNLRTSAIMLIGDLVK
ncbi:SGNH/GDSL hydrolase family protein [Planctomycetales bacterium ZRK34]|nr:SGNH/GDSL hydrolase family protein [Planctomycetales bacterium ZRK34]